MLNLLIALMGDSYEKVQESAEVEFRRQRAQLLREYEFHMPKKRRDDPRLFPRWLHVLKPKGADGGDDDGGDEDEEWVCTVTAIKNETKRVKGTVRKMQQEIDAMIGKAEAATQAKVEAKVGAVEAKVDAGQAKIEAKVDSGQAKMDAIEAGQATAQAKMDAIEAKVAKIEKTLAEVLELVKAMSTATVANSSAVVVGKRHVALYDFAGEGEDELRLEAGDVVVVTETSPEGWWAGFVEGDDGAGREMKSGAFPASCEFARRAPLVAFVCTM